MAPETPTLTSRSGATATPVCPTWWAYSSQPASTSGRVHPSSAPMSSASRLMRGRFFLDPMPRPTTTSRRASAIDAAAAAGLRSSTRTRGATPASSATSETVPVRDVSRAGAANTPGRTVAIWGRWAGQTMVAMRLPPNAGRVCWSSPVSGSADSAVQSAVSPVRSRTATAGASSRPNAVAPYRIASGRRSRASAQIQRAKTSASGSARRASRQTITSSAPAAMRSRGPAPSAAGPAPSTAVSAQPRSSAIVRARPRSSRATGSTRPSGPVWAKTQMPR